MSVWKIRRFSIDSESDPGGNYLITKNILHSWNILPGQKFWVEVRYPILILNHMFYYEYFLWSILFFFSLSALHLRSSYDLNFSKSLNLCKNLSDTLIRWLYGIMMARRNHECILLSFNEISILLYYYHLNLRYLLILELIIMGLWNLIKKIGLYFLLI